MKEKIINNLYCREYGNGSKTVIMIHGACVDADFFNDTAQYLSKWYHIITYDRRGYGRNNESLDYSIDAQINDIHEIIESLNGEINIVAHSAGTILAMKYMLKYGNKVNKCFLYEPVVSGIVRKDQNYIDTLRKVENKIKENKIMGAVSLFFTLMGEKDKRARSASEDEIMHVNKNCRNFIKNEFNEIYYERIEIEKIKIPIFIGLGERSLNTAREEMAMYVKEKTDSKLIWFPGGHNCPFDLPREFSYLVSRILEE